MVWPGGTRSVTSAAKHVPFHPIQNPSDRPGPSGPLVPVPLQLRFPSWEHQPLSHPLFRLQRFPHFPGSTFLSPPQAHRTISKANGNGKRYTREKAEQRALQKRVLRAPVFESHLADIFSLLVARPQYSVGTAVSSERIPAFVISSVVPVAAPIPRLEENTLRQGLYTAASPLFYWFASSPCIVPFHFLDAIHVPIVCVILPVGRVSCPFVRVTLRPNTLHSCSPAIDAEASPPP
jgi:hypothetical protein